MNLNLYILVTVRTFLMSEQHPAVRNPVILEKVLSYLPTEDIKSLPRVSPACRQAAMVKKFWYPVMLEQVFSFLPPSDIKTVRLVCRSDSFQLRTLPVVATK